MTVVMTMVMSFVITMIVVMIVFVIIVVAMIFVMVVIMVIVMIMIFVIFVMVVMIIDVNLAVKVFCFSPNQSRPNGSFDRKRAAIAKAPLKDATKHAIDGVVLGITLKVGVKSTMAFDGDDGREVEFTGFKGFTRSTMGAMGLSLIHI